jgi:RND family efflux transporter MFP subunit
MGLRRSGTAVVVVAWLAAGGCGGGAPTGDGPAKGRGAAIAPVAVRVGKVETAPAPILVQASGSFEPQDQATVAAEVAGRVVEIGPEIGDRIEPGKLLARLDATDHVLLRDQRARVLAEALTKLGLDRLPEETPGKDPLDFERLPSVERARLEAQNAKARHDRALRLNERTPGSVSTQDLADLKVEWDVAESALRGARLAARTDLAQARTRAAELAVAEQDVKDTEVTTPPGVGSWVVAERRVAAGDFVSVGSVLYRLLDTDPLRLVVRVPERRMAGVEKGRPVSVETASRKEPVPGTVLRVRPEVDLRTRTHDVEIEVRNPDGRLAVGAFAVAHVDVGEDPAVPVVPRSAVVTFAGVTKVFVPAEGKVGEQRVTLGRVLGERVEVTRGLEPGAPIVLDPPPDLVSGAPIAAGAPPASAAAPAPSPPAPPR